MLLVLLIVSFASFVIIKVAPGDILMSYVRPEMSNEDIEELREELGLNGSILSQYRKSITVCVPVHRPVKRRCACWGPWGCRIRSSAGISIPMSFPAGCASGP